MKKIISLIMVMVLILSCSSFSMAANSGKTTYLKLIQSDIKALNKVSNSYNFLADTNYKTQRQTVEIYGENLPLEFSNLKLTTLEEEDKTKNYDYAKVTLGTRETEKLNVHVSFQNNVLRMQIPEIYDKTIVIDFNDLKNLCEKFEIDLSEEEINSIIAMLSNVNKGSVLTKDDEAYLKKVSKEYAKKITNLLNDKYFSSKTSDSIIYNGKTVKCKSVTLELPMLDVYGILNEILKDVRSDEKLLTIFATSMASSGRPVTKEEIIDGIDEYLEDLEYSLAYMTDEKIVSTYYYNNKNEVLKREISVITDYDTAKLGFVAIKNKKDAYYELETDNLLIKDYVTINSKKENHSIEFNLITEKVDWEAYGEVSDMYYDYMDEYYDSYYDAYDSYSDFVEKRYNIVYPNYSDYQIKETTTYNANLLIETLDKYTTSYTFTVKDNPNSVKLDIYKNQANKNKLIYNLKLAVTYNYNEYKLYVNSTTERGLKITPRIFASELKINNLSIDELIAEFDPKREEILQKITNIFNELFPTSSELLQEKIGL
ncbi:MAG: hypothetical protein IJS47_00875 [Clostridia bacterium]|nr:hypothetical protein [Clostridia bacterium]